MHVHLVDGTYELFRCFHGAPRATGASGCEVGACRGLLATLAALVSEPDVSHVAVVFDSVITPPRSDKAAGSADALVAAQTPLAATVVRALGLVLWPAPRASADDVIATAAARLHDDRRVDRVVICGTDLDLAQCIRGERVVLLDRSRRITTDEAAVVARFGVPPGQLADLFGLVGDRSDGWAGVPGWGLKSAAAVLARYGTIDAIPGDAAAWDVGVRGAHRLAEQLRDRRDEAVMARDLLRLRTDLPMSVDVERLAWAGASRARCAAVTAELGEVEMLDRMPRWRRE